MSKKTIVLIAFTILIVFVAVLIAEFQSEIPGEVEELYKIKKAWINSKLEEWKPKEYKPMIFNGHHILASDMMVKYTDEEIDKLFLDMLCELNVDSISLYIFDSNYWEYQERYDKLVAAIRERGKKLVINAYTFPRKNERLDEFFSRYASFELYIIERYKPDYLLVLTEPSIIGGVKMPPEKLREFTVNVSREVRSRNLTVNLMVVVHTLELKLIPYFIDVEGLDYIGINVYGERKIESVEKAIDYIREHGKKPTLFETWWLTQKRVIRDETGRRVRVEYYPWFRDCYWQEINSNWIRVIAYFIQKKGLENTFLNPFFTEQFVYCNKERGKALEEQFREMLTAVKNKDRTQTFYAYKQLIEEVKKACG